MIVSGYYGELIVTGDLTPRWICVRFLSPCASFCTSSTSFSSGSLSNATNRTESNPVIKGKMDKDLKTNMFVQAQAWQRFWGSCQPPGDPRGQIETGEG